MGLPPTTLCCGRRWWWGRIWTCWKTLASTAWSSLSLLHRLEHSCIDLDRLSRPHVAATGLMLVFPLPPFSIHWLVITVPITLAKNWRYTSIHGSIPTSFNRLPREPWKPTAMDLAMFSQGATRFLLHWTWKCTYMDQYGSPNPLSTYTQIMTWDMYLSPVGEHLGSTYLCLNNSLDSSKLNNCEDFLRSTGPGHWPFGCPRTTVFLLESYTYYIVIIHTVQ